MRTDEFDYRLPDDAIAQTPLAQRDAARLLRVSDLTDHYVRDLPHLVRPGDIVVVNSSRVRAARLAGRRQTGGAVELLLLGRSGDGANTWQALVKPARRIRVGETIDVGRSMVARVVEGPEHGQVIVRLMTSDGRSVEDAIEVEGVVPLPPYIRVDLEDRDRYQTIFADATGSAAAPTAGLHFTAGLVRELKRAGVGIAAVELQVGLDTFRPVTTELIEDHVIHSEVCAIDPRAAEAVNRCRAAGGRIVAVGTTVARTLETFATRDGRVEAGRRNTSLYITPGYRFAAVDLLMTNFHVPRSSLLVMIAAFGGEVWRTAYETALARNYRFLSFGDAMLLEGTA